MLACRVHTPARASAPHDAVAGGPCRQAGRAGGDRADVRGMRMHASLAPGQPGGTGNPHADQRGEPAQYYVGGGALGGSRQTQQGHMNYVQLGAYGGGPGSGNGGNDMSDPGRGARMGGQNGGMMMQQQQQQQGNVYRNPGNGGGVYSQPMMRVPSSGSLGMMLPGNPGYGYGGEQGQAHGEFEADRKGSKRAVAGKNAGGKDAGAKRDEDGKGAEMMDGGAGGAGTWSYGTSHPQMRPGMQQGGMVYHQRNPSSHRIMTQQQHMGSMYSGSSSVSTTISGNSAGLGRGGGNGGMMMMPPYYMNQSGVGPNDGQIHVRGSGITSDMSAAEAGLVELEAIIGKLDKATSHNIKESLYRMARSAGARRVSRSGGKDGSQLASGQAQQPSDKAQSSVDRCVANLLYHRYPDAPAETPDAFQEGGQSQQMDGAGDGGNGRGVVAVPAGMNVIRGRHGSA